MSGAQIDGTGSSASSFMREGALCCRGIKIEQRGGVRAILLHVASTVRKGDDHG
jgi:hypothetical protein